eukprot:GHRQ01034246.1.p2 GENE.GHRQ01034246.1~~GHRQ01034246.1.p2  ORF type:complete len:137 (+),score=21.33 GHRQ01034246.1:17-427(+)
MYMTICHTTVRTRQATLSHHAYTAASQSSHLPHMSHCGMAGTPEVWLGTATTQQDMSGPHLPHLLLVCQLRLKLLDGCPVGGVLQRHLLNEHLLVMHLVFKEAACQQAVRATAPAAAREYGMAAEFRCSVALQRAS